jgi:quercetin dioxygenase-like cupin family protein
MKTTLPHLNGTATILTSRHETGGVSVIDVSMPAGTVSVVHAHDEDESIRVLEGRISFDVDGETFLAEPGRTVVLPKGRPHSYAIASAEGARWLSISSPGRFEEFVRAAARPEIADSPIALTVAAAESGIEILGPAPVHEPALALAA